MVVASAALLHRRRPARAEYALCAIRRPRRTHRGPKLSSEPRSAVCAVRGEARAGAPARSSTRPAPSSGRSSRPVALLPVQPWGDASAATAAGDSASSVSRRTSDRTLPADQPMRSRSNRALPSALRSGTSTDQPLQPATVHFGRPRAPPARDHFRPTSQRYTPRHCNLTGPSVDLAVTGRTDSMISLSSGHSRSTWPPRSLKAARATTPERSPPASRPDNGTERYRRSRTVG